VEDWVEGRQMRLRSVCSCGLSTDEVGGVSCRILSDSDDGHVFLWCSIVSASMMELRYGDISALSWEIS
jgi:hypothetical protein